MMRRLKKFFVLATLVVSVATLTYFIAQERPREALLGLDRSAAVAIFVLSVLSLVLRGLQFRAVALPFDVRLGRAEATGLSALHTLSNYLPARGGILVRGVYLNRVHSMDPLDYTAMTGLWFAGNALSATVLGAASALTLPSPTSWQALAFFAIVSMLLVLAVGIGARTTSAVSLTRASRWLRRLSSGLRKWRSRGRWRISFAASGLGLLLVAALRFSVAASALGYSISLVEALIIQAVLSLSLIVSVTPGNVGVREALAFGLGLALRLDPAAALAAAVIERAVGLLVAVLGSILLGQGVMRRRQAALE